MLLCKEPSYAVFVFEALAMSERGVWKDTDLWAVAEHVAAMDPMAHNAGFRRLWCAAGALTSKLVDLRRLMLVDVQQGQCRLPLIRIPTLRAFQKSGLVPGRLDKNKFATEPYQEARRSPPHRHGDVPVAKIHEPPEHYGEHDSRYEGIHEPIAE